MEIRPATQATLRSKSYSWPQFIAFRSVPSGHARIGRGGRTVILRGRPELTSSTSSTRYAYCGLPGLTAIARKIIVRSLFPPVTAITSNVIAQPPKLKSRTAPWNPICSAISLSLGGSFGKAASPSLLSCSSCMRGFPVFGISAQRNIPVKAKATTATIALLILGLSPCFL